MDQGNLVLSDREFERIKARVYREAGIALSDAKRTLVILPSHCKFPLFLRHEPQVV